MRIYLFYLAVMGLSWSFTILAIGAPIRKLVDFLFSKPPVSGDGEDLDVCLPNEEEAKPDEMTKIQILFHCPACISFWIAFALSLLVYSPCLDSGVTGVIILASVLDGLVAVGVNWVMHVVLTRLGQYDL